MVSSLVTVSKTLGQSRETAQRQLNAEKRKRKDGPRLESLNKALSETHEKITTAEEMMRKIFTGLAFSGCLVNKYKSLVNLVGLSMLISLI